MSVIKIRAHHLLCTILYQGKGYDEKFTSYMNQLVNEIAASDGIVLIVGPDEACANCPNLNEDKICVLNENDSLSKDTTLLRVLNLKDNEVYDRKELIAFLKESITEEIFNSVCATCRWHKEGLCSYQLLIEKLEKMEN